MGASAAGMWNGSDKYQTILDTIESNFEVVEKYLSDQLKGEDQLTITPRFVGGAGRDGW